MRKETPKTQSLTISLVSLNQPQYIPGILQIYANLRNQTPCGFVLSNAKHAHLTAPPAPDGSGAAPTALARGLCGGVLDASVLVPENDGQRVRERSRTPIDSM